MMNRMRKLFQRLHITGVSSPIGGLSWQTSAGDRETIRKLLIYLEGRRALFPHPHHYLSLLNVAYSIQKLRSAINLALQALTEGSPGEPWLRAMQDACEAFLDATKRLRVDMTERKTTVLDAASEKTYLDALHRLHVVIATHTTYLCAKFTIAPYGNLSKTRTHEQEWGDT